MTKYIIKKFISNSEDINNPEVRKNYGIVSGFVGIFCNVILFISKIIAGILTSSVSITADAFNNLSDAGSSIVTIIGFKLADKPADADHPFGHGRIEYISGFIVSIVILIVGLELIKSSIVKIINPEPIDFNIVSLAIMVISILIKLWMSVYNRYVGKKIDSSTIQAVAADSLNDVVATSAVVIGIVINYFTSLNIDGIMGCVVAIFIIKAGLETAKDTIDPLLGQAPEQSFVDAIESEVLKYDIVIGIHDLTVHNYGPGRTIVSLHAEVPCNVGILEIHDTIDNIEKHINQKFNCESVIHMDPIMVDNENINKLHDVVKNIIHNVDDSMSMHDFRVVEGPTHTNLIFDIAVPWKCKMADDEIINSIQKEIDKLEDRFELVIQIDKVYS